MLLDSISVLVCLSVSLCINSLVFVFVCVCVCWCVCNVHVYRCPVYKWAWWLGVAPHRSTTPLLPTCHLFHKLTLPFLPWTHLPKKFFTVSRMSSWPLLICLLCWAAFGCDSLSLCSGMFDLSFVSLLSPYRHLSHLLTLRALCGLVSPQGNAGNAGAGRCWQISWVDILESRYPEDSASRQEALPNQPPSFTDGQVHLGYPQHGKHLLRSISWIDNVV